MLHGGKVVGHRGLYMNMGINTHVYDGDAHALTIDDMCACVYEVDFIWDSIHLDMCNRQG